MQNLTVESRSQNLRGSARRINYASSTQTLILGTTSQRKVETKIEISITRHQLNETKWLFEQYGKPKPTWLRQKFYINQRRRKCLNDNLREAQLDKAYCGKCCGYEDWSGLLHSVWHNINGRPLCV